MHSEAQRLLGIPSVDSCHPNDVMSSGNQTQIEVRHDKCILPHTSSNTCISGISRSLSQSMSSNCILLSCRFLLTQLCQPNCFKWTNPTDLSHVPAVVIEGRKHPLSSLEPHYSHPIDKLHPWEGQWRGDLKWRSRCTVRSLVISQLNIWHLPLMRDAFLEEKWIHLSVYFCPRGHIGQVVGMLRVTHHNSMPLRPLAKYYLCNIPQRSACNAGSYGVEFTQVPLNEG